MKNKSSTTLHDPAHGSFSNLISQHKEVRHEAEKQGADDGKRNKPASDDPNALAFADLMNHRYQEIFARYAEPVNTEIAEYDTRLDSLSQEIELHEQTRQLALIQSDALHKQDLLTSQEKNLGDDVAEIENRFEVVKTEYDRPTGETDGIGAFVKHPELFFATLIILGLLERYFYLVSLETLNLNAVEVASLSTLVILVLIYLCHLTGISLKRRRQKANRVIFGISLGLLVAFSVVSPVIRYKYVKEEQIALVSADDMFVEYPIVWKEMLGDYDFWIFFVINAIIIFVMILLSYLKSDSEKKVQDSWREYHVDRPGLISKIRDLRTRKNDAERVMQARLRVALAKINPDLRQKVDGYEQTLSVRNTATATINNFAAQCEQSAQETVKTYQYHNRRHRTIPDPIGWIQHDFNLKLPRIELRPNNILKLFKPGEK